jgi:molecular chaperone GrpE
LVGLGLGGRRYQVVFLVEDNATACAGTSDHDQRNTHDPSPKDERSKHERKMSDFDDTIGAPSDPQLADLATCQEALAEARQESEQHRDALLRARADLENMRKRMAREIDKAQKYGIGRFTEALLPVKDSLELALAAAEQSADDGSLTKGIEIALGEFDRVLREFGVETVDPQGEPFDPERHEAVGVEEPAELPANTVCRVQQKGYLLNGRLVRPARVIVSKSS